MAKETKESNSAGAEPEDEFKYIVRISNTDLNGHKKVAVALTGVKGIGDRLACILADKAGVDRHAKIGDLDDGSIDKLKVQVEQELFDTIPVWMANRRRDINTGEDKHILTTDLDQTRRDDLNRLKKIRSRRGIRHETKQKVRGQRSRSNGRSGLSMGVQRKKD